ncbi:XRE family transcriptional regulator [Paenibacillus sp. GYB006]|uniref:XRE family transcriptional regulator n=1 Tax=Paenibacillus sp. GYB006 TaxID=2994394 RepID=UPI002F967673
MKNLITKTVLEYLVMINDQSYSGIGRELNITPQQFSDWIKKRRPIPQERVRLLSNYFGVEETILIDHQYFVKPLTPIARIELHKLLLGRKLTELKTEEVSKEDIRPYLEKKKQLEQEYRDQLRLTRMAAILEKGDERAGNIFDMVIEELESGRMDELFNKLRK